MMVKLIRSLFTRSAIAFFLFANVAAAQHIPSQMISPYVV